MAWMLIQPHDLTQVSQRELQAAWISWAESTSENEKWGGMGTSSHACTCAVDLHSLWPKGRFAFLCVTLR
jgi:hypothetical protein